MNMPLVSIIIATYRRDNYLNRAIQSALGQSYRPIEIIIVDDNANDEWNLKVESIISFFNTNLIHYIRNSENKGSAESRNNGICKANGEYVTFLDDDDIYLPEKVSQQTQHMLTTSTDVSITDISLYNDNNHLIEKRVRNYIIDAKSEDLLKFHLMYHITGTDTLMFKKDFLLQIGCFPLINIGDEFYLMMEAIKAGCKLSYLPRCDVIAYMHTNTAGLSNSNNRINGENILFEYKKKYFNRLDKKSIIYITIRHYAVLAFTYLRIKNYISTINYCFKAFFLSPSISIKILFNR